MMFLKKFLFAITFISIAIVISIAGYLFFANQNPALAQVTDCAHSNILCVDSVAGANQEYSTIQSATNAANAGDTILVFPGTYNERITFPSGKTGVVGNKITFKSQTIRAAFMNGFNTTNADYLRIEGFDITYNGGWLGGGIWLASNNVEVADNYFHDIPGAAIQASWSSGVMRDNISIANNRIYKCERGIVVYGKNWIVENNEIERLVYTAGDADYMRFFGENHIIRNNYFHGTLQSEIGASHTDGFQTFAVNAGEYAKNIIIEGNILEDFYHQGMMLEGKTGTADNIIVRNNIFANAVSWGIAADGIANLQVFNNNFINTGFHGVGFEDSSDGTPTTGIVQNNIFYNGGSNYWKKGTCSTCALTGGYNIINAEKYPYHRESTDIVGADPLFSNIGIHDFHLQSNSPAKDAGATIVGFTTDKDGVSRPQGSAWDIGAYEYIQASQPLKGDFNSDKKVNDLDFTDFKNAFKSIFNSLFDLNSDSIIDVKDLGVLMNGWLP